MDNRIDFTAAGILKRLMGKVTPLPSQKVFADDLAAIFSMHLHRNQLMDQGFSADELPTPTALIVALTGQGKTYLVRKMADLVTAWRIFSSCSMAGRLPLIRIAKRRSI